MARSICPSCGEPFNGKKCKNCEYEVFGDIGNPELHGRQDTHTCAPGQTHTHTHPQSRTSNGNPFGGTLVRQKRGQRKKLSASLIIILILLFAVPLLNLLGAVVFGIIDAVDSVSSFASPEPEAAIPEGAEVIYSDGKYTVWAAWEDALDSGAIPVVAENHTSRSVNITAPAVVLNGNYLSKGNSLYITVPQGKKAEGTLYLEDAAAIGLEQLSLVSFRLHVYDAETYDTLLDTEPITLSASNGATPKPAEEPDGKPVTEAEGIRVYFLGLTPDAYEPEDLTQSTLDFCLVNDTEQTLAFQSENARINGQIKILPMWRELPPHTLTYTSIYLHTLEDLDITRKSEVESIQIYLQVSDESETYGENGILDLEPFTITLDD